MEAVQKPTSGEPENNDEKKPLTDRLFRFGDGDALYFRGRKCKYVRDLLNVQHQRAAMKKLLLLSGVAALFLATGTAHADAELPEQFVGQYCYKPDKDTETQEFYSLDWTLCDGGSLYVKRRDGRTRTAYLPFR